MEYILNDNIDESKKDIIRKRLREYNERYWEDNNLINYSIEVKNNDTLIGGICFSVFGEWLEIQYLWVEDQYIGKGIGTQLLERAESEGRKRGCKKASLDTMSFQAKPFYMKHGYYEVYAKEHYPRTSTKYYMEKNLKIHEN